jgi:hypothetical protein
MEYLLVKSAFSTLGGSELYEDLGEGKHSLELSHFNPVDQGVWQIFIKALGFESVPTSLGTLTVTEKLEYKYFNFPSVLNKDGVLILSLFGQEYPLSLEKPKRSVECFGIINDKEISFTLDKGEYPDPNNINGKIPFPVLVFLDEEGNTFRIKIKIAEKPSDPAKQDASKQYYDHAAFTSAWNKGEFEKALAFVQGDFNKGVDCSVSYLFTRLFESKQFLPGGIVIPITEIYANQTQYGISYACSIDPARSWSVAAPDKKIPIESIVSVAGSKNKGFTDVPFSVVTTLWITSDQRPGQKIKANIDAGNPLPTHENPWFLWVQEQGKQVNTVPVCDIIRGSRIGKNYKISGRIPKELKTLLGATEVAELPFQ